MGPVRPFEAEAHLIPAALREVAWKGTRQPYTKYESGHQPGRIQSPQQQSGIAVLCRVFRGAELSGERGGDLLEHLGRQHQTVCMLERLRAQ